MVNLRRFGGIFVALALALVVLIARLYDVQVVQHEVWAREAANLMRYKAAWLFEQDLPCGAEANMAKYLGAEAAWQAANACLDTHGGFGFAEEYDVERKFRETRLYKVAPVSNNLILAYLGQHVLGMPRSY